MNSIVHTDHSRRTSHLRLGAAAWDDFEPTTRRRSAHARPAARTKARVRHAHISFAETPDLYLREEMG
jgi:hypothetical protein